MPGTALMNYPTQQYQTHPSQSGLPKASKPTVEALCQNPLRAFAAPSSFFAVSCNDPSYNGGKFTTLYQISKPCAAIDQTDDSPAFLLSAKNSLFF